MNQLSWIGTFKVDTFVDTGTPGDPTSGTPFQVQGIASLDTWGDANNVYTLNGTADADLIYLDTSNTDTPRLINVTLINSGSGNDIVDLTSPRFYYGAVTIDGGSGNDWLLGNIGRDRLLGQDGRDWIKGYGGNDHIDGGRDHDLLYGGRGNDTVKGSSGNDHLFGGLGKDTLSGGSGSDKFVFDTTPTKSNTDTITDFSVKYDSVHLEKDVFTKAGALGRLKSSAFWSGDSAHDRSDRIIYNDDTGYLYYDPDGTGSASQRTIAKLSKNLSITEKDFFIV
ncbi:calcium-binding protein [Microvirga sp. CF3016]|uniref:calcium-binding protein n=1 Tax=Microvirga sp. CF3016 TaxID=3110181 RepID=UPI002E7A2EEF|nr:calcium-binding protein [Microvirga sp. CF3016]MEE1613210.1 calcium-binding protein [Microvirga sp. CF3016]